ncbi:MAG: S9 family peptidase [Cyanobacteria bacterium SZAS LIN-2]|nr:S9 family peptidase [Cyanobacteria bacterium SZAS LIN-2]
MTNGTNYGGWRSPITASMVAAGALRLSQPYYDRGEGGALYYLEGRPAEAGRQVLVKRPGAGGPLTPGAPLEDVTPAPVSVRTLVHEYGGGAYTVSRGTVFYSNYADQRVYIAPPASAAVPLSVEGPYRFADYFVDQKRQRLLAVMEDHSRVKSGEAAEPENSIVALSFAGFGGGGVVADRPSEPVKLCAGFDFYGFPRLSPDGSRLAYIRWNHPNLPWDDSELVVADLDQNGQPVNERVVAGGKDCSVFQPEWGPDGTLYFVCDSSGFWNLYAVRDWQSLQVESLIPRVFAECEFGQPMWVFGQSTYVVASEKLIICAVNRRGLWHLARLELDFEGGHKLLEILSPYTDFSYLTLGDNCVAMLAGSADRPSAVVEYDWASRSFTTIKSSAAEVPPTGYLSKPEVIEFPTTGDRTAFAFYYPPTNRDYPDPDADGKLPPLLVKCHGGPTGAASSVLSLGLQFWTSRGFAVVDVNYGGSTGFGRAYRKRLNDNWGLVDVDDCVSAVEYLVKEGRVDGARVAITGGSAGGYTVLSALTFKDVFRAGASHYGIGDLEALARDTHKFEARYLDNLVGPYPQAKSIYVERSPINHIELLKCPVIFFQGLDDKVVPPNQAEAMVDALKAKNIPVAYIAYEGEQHGFRQAANIIRTLESELYFFRQIFKIESEEKLAPVSITNLSA